MATVYEINEIKSVLITHPTQDIRMFQRNEYDLTCNVVGVRARRKSVVDSQWILYPWHRVISLIEL